MHSLFLPVYNVSWKIIERDLQGNIVSVHEKNNMVVDTGREQDLRNLFAVGASGPFISVGVGASTTAAVETQTRLVHELIDGYPTTQRKPLFDKNNNSLDNADIETDVYTPPSSSVTYRRKLIVQATWDSTDARNGNQFAEYGLFTSLTCPSTPTGTSGTMFNRFVDGAPLLKTASNSITAQITIRN